MHALGNRRRLGLLLAAVLVAALALIGRLALRPSAPTATVTVVEGSARVGQPAPRVELPDLPSPVWRARL